jgi:alpha-galactosidase
LDPNKNYQIKEINKNGKSRFWGNGQTFSADYLMNVGVELKIADQYDSALFMLKVVG